MAKHLNDKDIERIVELLDGWSNKLTWDALCEACRPVVGVAPVRQTLYRSARIRYSYKQTKDRLRDESSELKVPPTLKAAAERISRLENENSRLKHENDLLLEQFVVWQYNAYIHGLTDRDLNKPLPAIDLGRTE